MSTDRRRFLQQLGIAGVGVLAAGLNACNNSSPDKDAKSDTTTTASQTAAALFFEISLAQWSLHKALEKKELDNLDFPAVARKDYGIGIVEYVNQFFKDKAEDTAYLNELLKRCSDNNIKNHLIMIDGEGDLGELDDKKRLVSVQNHYKWVGAAKHLGCATIRVNAYGVGSREDVQKAAIDGLGRLGEFAAKENINVLVENHGSYSSDGQWLSAVMKAVNKLNVGTLPDFGNFCIKRDGKGLYDGNCIEEYDRYKGVQEMMPFAKGVSAKSHEFDEQGNCTDTDYVRMLKIVKDAGFRGYIGIEYEGDKLSEPDGIKKTKALLEKVGATV
ncbi:MAG TPA: sugar phosphate isomerase/epimerase family protein [Chitinophagaceae bacterium]